MAKIPAGVMPGLVPGIHVFLVMALNLKTWMAGQKGVYARLRRAMPGHDAEFEIRTRRSGQSFSSFFTFPDAICARCCSVTGSASSHFRPGSFFT